VSRTVLSALLVIGSMELDSKYFFTNSIRLKVHRAKDRATFLCTCRSL
jgi:hypothetical protein